MLILSFQLFRQKTKTICNNNYQIMRSVEIRTCRNNYYPETTPHVKEICIKHTPWVAMNKAPKLSLQFSTKMLNYAKVIQIEQVTMVNTISSWCHKKFIWLCLCYGQNSIPQTHQELERNLKQKMVKKLQLVSKQYSEMQGIKSSKSIYLYMQSKSW